MFRTTSSLRALAAALVASALFITGNTATAAMGACTSAAAKDDPASQIRLYTLCIEGGQMRPKDLAGAFNNRGVAYLNDNQIDAAFADFSKSIQYDPKFGMAWLNRALIHLERDELTQALADLEQVVQVRPARIHHEAYLLLAKTHYAMGNTAAALDNVNLALKRKRKFAEALEFKAWLTTPEGSGQE